MPARDPERVRECRCCGGPVYHDEPPDCHCPDCRAILNRMAEAHSKAPPRGEYEPRVYRVDPAALAALD